jgi:hypothetical protein
MNDSIIIVEDFPEESKKIDETTTTIEVINEVDTETKKLWHYNDEQVNI